MVSDRALGLVGAEGQGQAVLWWDAFDRQARDGPEAEALDDVGRVSLTTLWKQMGALPKKRPALWLKSDPIKEFMLKLKAEAEERHEEIRKEREESTFVFWKVALFYCAFLSPKMKSAFVKVVRKRFNLDDDLEKALVYYGEEIESSS